MLKKYNGPCNSHPVRMAGKGSVPACAVGRAVAPGDSIGSLATGDSGVVVAGDNAGGPDFVCAVAAIVGVDFRAEPLVHLLHVAIL